MTNFKVLAFLTISYFQADSGVAAYLLQGKTLRVVVGNFPPSSAVIRNSTGQVIGFSGGLFKQFEWISEHLKFDFIPSAAVQNTAGIKINSTFWTGMIGSLLMGEYDVSLGPFAIQLDRSEAIDFAGFVGGDLGTMLVRYPSTEKSFYASLKPFSINTWIGLLVSAPTVLTFSYILTYCYMKSIGLGNRELNLNRMTVNFLMFMWGIFFSQGHHLLFHNHSIRLLSISWLLVATIFVYAYNSTLISYLSVDYRRPDVSTFRELVNNEQYQFVTLKGSIVELDILSALSGDLRGLSSKLLKCPSCRITDIDKAIEKVSNGNYVAILPSTVVLKIIYGNLSPDGDCQFTKGKDTTTWKPMYFGLPKSSPFQREIELGAQRCISHGLVIYERRQYGISRTDCLLRYNSRGYDAKTTNSPLKLKQFYFPLLLLLIGCCLSTLQFLREITDVCYKRRRTR